MASMLLNPDFKNNPDVTDGVQHHCESGQSDLLQVWICPALLAPSVLCFSFFNSEKCRLLIRKSLQRDSLSSLQHTQQVFVSLLPSDCRSMHSLVDYCSPPAAPICGGHMMSRCFNVLSRTFLSQDGEDTKSLYFFLREKLTNTQLL